MNFEPELTEGMRRYLEADPAERDHADGARIFLRISGLVHVYNQIMRGGPDNFAPFLESKLRNYYEFRLARMTHEQVAELSAKADSAVGTADSKEEELRAGKRKDHDSLPEDVRAAYVEALNCLNKERELHLQIRRLALHEATCPDSELYPFVKEIVRLDERRLELWKLYDSYVKK